MSRKRVQCEDSIYLVVLAAARLEWGSCSLEAVRAFVQAAGVATWRKTVRLLGRQETRLSPKESTTASEAENMGDAVLRNETVQLTINFVVGWQNTGGATSS